MSTWIITLLISLGLIISMEQWNSMSKEEQENVHSIIIDIETISLAPAYEFAPNTHHLDVITSEAV
ncbi:MAG: hypothetical protein JNM22_17045 [Saprospiraceae bacterium]|nr:hypothetical protein [Saprospiraceae bacterium]